MPDDFLHRVQLLATTFRLYADDLLDAAQHLRDHKIRDAFKDHPHFTDGGMSRRLTKEWGHPVTAEQIKIARTQTGRFRMVYDRAQNTRSDLRDLLSKVCAASKALSPGAPERKLFPVIEAITPLIDEPFDESSLTDRAEPARECSAKLSTEVAAIVTQHSETAFDRTLFEERAIEQRLPLAPTTREPAAETDTSPDQTLQELIAQFLYEADQYLTHWNLFRSWLSLAKPIERP
jgi:hypothetical protein